MNKQGGRVIFSLLSILLVLSGCAEKAQNAASQQAPPTVVLSEAAKQNVQTYQTFSGKTVPFQTVDIVSRVSGNIEEIKYIQGEIVAPEQVLFTIQDFDYQVAQSKAYAELKMAVTQQDVHKSLYESALESNRLTPNTVTADEMVQKKAAYENAIAKVYAAQAEYQYQTQQLYYTQIKSPIRGKVQKNLVDVGNYVQGNGSKVLTTVVEMNPMYVEFDVPEALFAKSYRQSIAKQGAPKIEEKAKPAANSDAPQKDKNLKAPQIPTATTESKVQAQPAFSAGPYSQFIHVVEPVANTPAKPAEKRAEEKAEEKPAVSGNIETPAIPKAEVTTIAKLPDSQGTGIVGKPMEQVKPEDVMSFEVTFMGDNESPTFKGAVIYADNVVNPTTGTILVRGEFQNPKYEVYPGRICTVRVPSDLLENVMVIQEQAIGTDLNTKYVWVLDAKGLVEKRYVQLGDLLPNGTERILKDYQEENVTSMDGTKSVVKTGLQPGEKYIIEGIQKVRPGIPVDPKSPVKK